MDIVIDSVNKLAEIIRHSGCEEGGVRLDVNADAKPCQFERGACVVASFGGRSAEFVTYDPIRAMTKISFLTGAPLDTQATRGAACAIINVALGFFCLSRVCHACPVSARTSCQNQLYSTLAGHRIHCIGAMPVIESDLKQYIIKDPQDAEIILINGDGIITEGTGDILVSLEGSKRILCLGPSTAGIARLRQWEHWCPSGK
jgi:hypothetical protein